jgi:hypothetical protein
LLVELTENIICELMDTVGIGAKTFSRIVAEVFKDLSACFVK